MKLEDRMGLYEQVETGRKFIPLLPICVRLDGDNFSKFTRDLEKPFDARLSELMIACTKFLVQETQAQVGYTQSDEVSLVYYSSVYASQTIYNGKVLKLNSELCSLLTAYFNKSLYKYILEKNNSLVTFDCKVWQVPTLEEASNNLLWRQRDATRNSILQAGRAIYSHKQLFGKNTDEVQEMLFEKGVNWNEYSLHFKQGTFTKKEKVVRLFTKTELANLPNKHKALKNPNLLVERNEFRTFHLDLNKSDDKVKDLFT